MPPFPVPAALKLFSGGVLFGGFWSPPEDYVAPHVVWGARFGLVLTDSPFEVEATFLAGQSNLRGSDVALSSGITRADLLFKLFQSPRIHVVAGPGLGWRYVQLDDDAIAAATADDDFGIGTNPVADLVLTAGGGVRAWIAGPIHLRADVNGAVQLGDQPETSPPHAWPALLATVALDLRWEPPPDRDRDGVPDRDDRCPDSLEDLDYYEDADGCLDPDDDKDDVPDVDDRCKDQPEDRDGFQDEDGCSDHNNDGDALPDVYDRCPDERETQNGWVDGDGCADALPIDVSPLMGTRQDIRFNGTELSPESIPLVEAIAAALVAHPAARLHIAVFTDSEGGLELARERSRAQALALHSVLLARGVAAPRLQMFAGADGVPVGADRADSDKPTNRRVVFTLRDPVDGEGRPLEFPTKLPEEW